MSIDMTAIMNWKFLIPAGIAAISFLFSVFNFLLGKATATKIVQNDLKHVNMDIAELKVENKEIRIDLKKDLHDIHLTMKRIERKQVNRDAICEERHNLRRGKKKK